MTKKKAIKNGSIVGQNHRKCEVHIVYNKCFYSHKNKSNQNLKKKKKNNSPLFKMCMEIKIK